MPDTALKRRQAVILISDIEGYSRMMGRDEVGTLTMLQKHRFAVIDPTVGQFRGRVVKSMGDGLLIEFQTVRDAVACAIDLQERIRRLNGQARGGLEITYRIGINRGEIIAEKNDIFGDGVNVAARLQEVADPEGVAVSSAVFADMEPEQQNGFTDIGAHRFKNIERPVRVYHHGLRPEDQATHTAFRPFVDLPLPDQAVATGGCLCGHVRYQASQAPLGSMLCHCSICRRFSGAPVLGGTTFLTEAITFTRAQPKFYRSSSIAKRGFCPECGTSISYHGLVGRWTKWMMVFTATLDDPENHPPTYHLGVEGAMPWLHIVDDLPRMECKDSPSLVDAYHAVGEEVP